MTEIHRDNNTNNNPLSNNLKIITHNVRGINNDLKRHLWLEYCNKQNIDIISITETKLAESRFSHLELQNPWYKIYTANNIPKNLKKRE